MVAVSAKATDQLLPRHLVVVMDGNGRWAKKRKLPRFMGHKRGVEATRRVVNLCGKYNIPCLTIFAFSTENWKRPREEIAELTKLFINGLDNELAALHKNGVKMTFIGDLSSFSKDLRSRVEVAEKLTLNNTRLILSICVNYGGRWDIMQAANRAVRKRVAAGRPAIISEALIEQELALSDLPPPDLLIRTSGEQRLSNFLLWQLAYTELYFTNTLWPDFDQKDFDAALDFFAQRERRFGSV